MIHGFIFYVPKHSSSNEYATYFTFLFSETNVNKKSNYRFLKIILFVLLNLDVSGQGSQEPSIKWKGKKQYLTGL